MSKRKFSNHIKAIANLVSKGNKQRAAGAASLLIVLISVCIFSCSKQDFGDNTADYLTVVSGVNIQTTDTLFLLQGKDSVLPFTVIPDTAYNPELEWTSGDSNIVTVKAGKLHAAALGIATVTAKSTDGTLKSASIVVNVIDHITAITAIDFVGVGTDTALYEGDAITLKAVVQPANATYKSLVWSSSDPTILSVSQAGAVKALKKGAAKITATAADGSGVSTGINIQVVEVVPVQSVTITSAFPDAVALGESDKLAFTVVPANATLNTLVWSSSNTSVVAVSADGTITALAPGLARVTVTSKFDNTVTAYIDLEVIAGKLDDTFNGTTTPWITSTGGATAKISDHQFVVTMTKAGAKYRGDFQRKGGATVDAGSYPIVAFKMERPAGAAGGANITFDTNLGAFGNGSNKFTLLTGRDGSTVYYYNIATGTFGSGNKMSTSEPTVLTTFQLKVADLVLTGAEAAQGKNIYHVDWVKSFKTLSELETFVDND